mgnify:CR=1 FL=1
MGDFHIKKIILPSGKAVEIVYYDADASRDEAVDRAVRDALDPHPATPAPRLDLCPCCGSELVYPIDWREAEGDAWELELRCPNCEERTRGVWGFDVVERFDDALNAATDALIGTLEEVSRENMREDIERFVDALNRDLILPFDF